MFPFHLSAEGAARRKHAGLAQAAAAKYPTSPLDWCSNVQADVVEVMPAAAAFHQSLSTMLVAPAQNRTFGALPP